MSKYTIEKNIPLPNKGYSSKYPMSSLEIGDSFFIPSHEKLARTSIYNLAKLRGIKIIIRVTKEGARIWRIK